MFGVCDRVCACVCLVCVRVCMFGVCDRVCACVCLVCVTMCARVYVWYV